MASPWLWTSSCSHSYLLSFVITTLPYHSLAQITNIDAFATALPTAISTSDDPGNFDLPTGSASVTSQPTDGTVPPIYSSNGDSEDDSGRGVLNYYFLLLFVLILIILLAYFFTIRRRQKKQARLQGNRQDALAQDLEGWNGGRRWVHGRWRSEPRVEGLNERGEAPPPYMPERPAETHAGGNNREGDGPIPLQDMHKPPDYQEGRVSLSSDQGPRLSERDV